MARYRLGSICQIISGSTPKTGVQEYWNGDKKWITPAELSESDYIIYDTERKLTEAGVKSAGLTPLPKGTVILSSRAPIGKVAIAGCEMYCNQGFKNFVCSDIINNKYLYWYLRSKTDFLNSLGRGATFKEISKSTVADIELDIPKLSEQSKRVAHLEKLQSIIASRRIQLAKLDELVKCRFVEMFGDIELNYKLEDLCSLITDGTHQPPQFTDSGIPFLLVSNIKENYINYETYKFIDEQTYRHLIKRTPVETGDLLLSTVGSYGHPAIVQGTQRFCFQRHIAFLKPIRERVNSVYLHQAILSDNVQEQIEKSVLGVAQKNLNLSAIRRLVIPYPPIEKQNSFAAFVRRIDKLRFVIQQSLDETQKLFDSLMQEYFD